MILLASTIMTGSLKNTTYTAQAKVKLYEHYSGRASNETGEGTFIFVRIIGQPNYATSNSASKQFEQLITGKCIFRRDSYL